MNLAILIGVSNYSNEKISNLNACKNDVDLINSLLQSTKKYDEILLIEKDTTSENVKKQLTEFIKKHTADKEKIIEEVFFYYSGHGQIYNDEFQYILSNFEFDKRNSTSLNNSELDNLLRNLNPKLAIKFIDACQSGISYVKEPGEFNIEKIINNEKRTFQNCYFMFSSHSNQFSGASEKISYFTLSFLKAITLSENGEIRYADIINHIKDDFAQPHSTQTPYFITQGDYTEVFCSITDTLKNSLLEKLSKLSSLKDGKTKSSKSLLDIIKKEAEEYCETPEEAFEYLKQVRENIFSYNFDEDLNNLYNITITEGDYFTDLPKINIIGEQLSKEDDYFVEIKYKTVKVQEEVRNVLSSFLKATYSINGTEPEKQYRTVEKQVISNIFLSEKSPFNRINIDFVSKFQNLPGFYLTLITAFSKKEFTIFYFYNKYKEVGWNQFEKIEDNVIWKYSKFPLKKVSEIEEKKKLEKIFQDTEGYILDFLKEKYKSQLTENDPPNGEETLAPMITSNSEKEEVKED